MKMTIGSKLFKIREDRKMNQAEMADLLVVSPATYSRLERNETSIELENLVSFAKKLNIPIQDLLPDTLSINNNTQTGQGQVVFGNIYYYANPDAPVEIDNRIKMLEEEIRAIREELKRN